MPAHTTEPLLRRLASGTASSAELERVSGASQSSASRLLRQLINDGRVIRIGSTRGARYAMRRNIEGIGDHWTLRRVQRDGGVETIGRMFSLAAGEYYIDTIPEAIDIDSLTSGLPYFLQDQRPEGFLGRAVPRRYPELNLPQRVVDWTDDHYLRYFVLRGYDAVGDLILGDQSFDEFLAMQEHCEPLRSDERAARYPRLVREVMEGGLPGSSAHGEHPKFAALIEDAAGRRHVLVKFSPPIGTAVGQRWSDLLVAEHLAHSLLNEAGIASLRSRIDRFADRTYLEVERFDREGLKGRIGVTSLLAIDTYRYGKLDSWIASATRLHDDRCIDAQTLETVRLVAAFGALTANTDRHFGNLAFYDQYNHRFILAPIYDMLPMLFAPEHDQVTDRIFTPPRPTAETFAAYDRARRLAHTYWQRLSQDPRISAEFREIGAQCSAAVDAVPRTSVRED